MYVTYLTLLYRQKGITQNYATFPQPPSLSHLATMPHIHLAMATKSPQLTNKSIIYIIQRL